MKSYKIVHMLEKELIGETLISPQNRLTELGVIIDLYLTDNSFIVIKYKEECEDGEIFEGFIKQSLSDEIIVASFHDWECISVGDYYSEYKCFHCGERYVDNIENVNDSWKKEKCSVLFETVKCNHEWVSAVNKVITSGEICIKCWSVRPEVLKDEQ